jgi:penicillin-binding protein 2
MYVLEQRLVKTFILIVVMFILLFLKLAGIQIIQGDYLAQKAVQLNAREVPLEEFCRGEITDRHGRPLAGGGAEGRLVLFPALIQDKENMASQLKSIVPGEFNFQLLLAGDPAIIPARLTPPQEAALKNLGHPGVMVLPVYLRYGSSPLAVHLSGHLSKATPAGGVLDVKRPGGWYGALGLERYYDQELAGQRAKTFARVYVDAMGRLVGSAPEVITRAKKDPGRQHVITTIDKEIQHIVEDVMDARVPLGAVVVMDARTGDLLAAASRPAFNPHPMAIGPALALGTEVFVDQSTALFQPGSIFKLVVAAAALEEGLVTSGTVFQCNGSAGPLISCWHGPGHGQITLEEAFTLSCNPTFAQLGLQLGADKLIAYARAFGLDNQEIIGYPVPVDPRQDLSLIGAGYHLVNSSVGQGPVLTTPVQIAAMMNVVVNSGVYLQPRLVKELRNDSSEIVTRFPHGPSKKVISSYTAARLKNMLETAAATGVGSHAFIPVYGSGGKTGSAQVSGDGGSINAWFAGYAPQARPRYVVVVLVRDGKSGGQTAAPVFREITEAILTNLQNYENEPVKLIVRG